MHAPENQNIAFGCDRCGACCKTFPVYAALADAAREPKIAAAGLRLKPWLETPAWAWLLHPLPFHDTCAFLGQDNLCSIYETRPEVCREFAAGSPQCQEARQRVSIAPLKPDTC